MKEINKHKHTWLSILSVFLLVKNKVAWYLLIALALASKQLQIVNLDTKTFLHVPLLLLTPKKVIYDFFGFD